MNDFYGLSRLELLLICLGGIVLWAVILGAILYGRRPPKLTEPRRTKKGRSSDPVKPRQQ